MKQIEFYRAMKQYCKDKKGDCTNCCLRLYCYTPPCERNDEMMNMVIQFLSENVSMDSPIHQDHYNVVERPCLLELNMTGTLGYDTRH